MLTKQGYIITKSDYSEKVLDEIRKDLTVTPENETFFGEKNESFKVFDENKDKMILPKHYGIQKLGIPSSICTYQTIKAKFTFKGQLRDQQKQIVDVIYPKLLEQTGGVISLPTGYGKTCIALYLASQLKGKTLIIVNKGFLLNQWRDRINQFIIGAKIGYIQQDNIDIYKKNIVIGMLQSISMKDYDSTIFDDFKTVIIDEVHHISSKVFSLALPKINSKYMIGLSATPERTDKLEKVFYWYIGSLLYRMNSANEHEVVVQIYRYTCDDENFKIIFNKYTKKPQMATIINNLVKIESRNNFIINTINQIKEDHPKRNILILSGRIEHLKILAKSLTQYTVGFYIGGMKEADLKQSDECEIILATYSYVAEAFDLPKLDTVIMVTGQKQIKQAIGRILRKKMDQYIYYPLIVDISDTLFFSQHKVRFGLYKSLNYRVEQYEVFNETIGKQKLFDFSNNFGHEQLKLEEQESQFLSDSD